MPGCLAAAGTRLELNRGDKHRRGAGSPIWQPARQRTAPHRPAPQRTAHRTAPHRTAASLLFHADIKAAGKSFASFISLSVRPSQEAGRAWPRRRALGLTPQLPGDTTHRVLRLPGVAWCCLAGLFLTALLNIQELGRALGRAEHGSVKRGW